MPGVTRESKDQQQSVTYSSLFGGNKAAIVNNPKITDEIISNGSQSPNKNSHHGLSDSSNSFGGAKNSPKQSGPQNSSFPLYQNQDNLTSFTSGPSKRISLYKTELCRSFEETGYCRYGLKCQFAHNVNELRTVARHPRYKTEICKTFWELGNCPYGKRCCFIHTEKDSQNTSDDQNYQPQKAELNNEQQSGSFRKKIEPPGALSISSSKFNPDNAPDYGKLNQDNHGDLMKQAEVSPVAWKTEDSPTQYYGINANYMVQNPSDFVQPSEAQLIPRSRMSFDIESSFRDFGKWPKAEQEDPIAKIDLSISKYGQKPISLSSSYSGTPSESFLHPRINLLNINSNNINNSQDNDAKEEKAKEDAIDASSIPSDMFKLLENLGI